LQPWQRDIIEIVRAEMLYFVPQMQTKTMNEGWACLDSNSLLLTKMGFIRYKALHDLLAKNEPIAVGSGGGILIKSLIGIFAITLPLFAYVLGVG